MWMVVMVVLLSMISAGSLAMFVFVSKRYLRWMKVAIQNEVELQDVNHKLAMKTIELEIHRSRIAKKNVLDGKTKALIRLAVSNPEKLEGESAAMLVCKRLKEKIDG
jgi:hypothetical protein